MKTFATLRSLLLALAVLASVPCADAARVGVLSNQNANVNPVTTATDFGSRLSGHSFFGRNVTSEEPALSTLLAEYDVLLLFEDRTFENAPRVGTVAANFARSGRPVVVATFYDQERTGSAITPKYTWGELESLDPNTSDGEPYPSGHPRSLDATKTLAHPLTRGVGTLYARQWAGGNAAKPGSVVVATWAQANALGGPDPAIAYRVTGSACVVHVAIAPHYPQLYPGGLDTPEFGGDFYRVWQNAFDFAARGCVDDSAIIPTLSDAGLVATALLLVLVTWVARRQAPARGRV